MIIRKFGIIDALIKLYPTGALYSLEGSSYEGLDWVDEVNAKPTKTQIEQTIVELQTAWDNLEYQRQRAAEYPPVADYLDAIVKGDETQKQAYIDACLEVKAKYPKPQGV